MPIAVFARRRVGAVFDEGSAAVLLAFEAPVGVVAAEVVVVPSCVHGNVRGQLCEWREGGELAIAPSLGLNRSSVDVGRVAEQHQGRRDQAR